ncbi:hypothetical protein BDR05DRAFT_974123 [Suillus weaverae]|nr:hypothetical protein BDR05DRAFT_974123 [Suillus weaverae]
MGNRKISPDLKLAAICLHERGILTTREILECVGFSRRTFLQICKLYCETGDVVKLHSEYIGRPRALNIEDVAYLTELVQHCPDWFLDELAGLLHKVAKEHNEDVRADFMRRMAHYTSDELCFIDETSKDDRTPFRRLVDGIIAGHIMEGSLRRKGYLNFLEHSVVSTLNCAGSPYFNCHLRYAASAL